MGDRLRTNLGLLLAFLAIIFTFLVPEVRAILGLDENNLGGEPMVEQDYLKYEEYEIEAMDLLADYISSWSERNYDDLEHLLSSDFYYSDYSDPRQDREAFLEEKRNIFNQHRWIKISTDKESIVFDDNTGSSGLISYYQHYETRLYESWGWNYLYIKRIGRNYKIVREKFSKERGGTK